MDSTRGVLAVLSGCHPQDDIVSVVVARKKSLDGRLAAHLHLVCDELLLQLSQGLVQVILVLYRSDLGQEHVVLLCLRQDLEQDFNMVFCQYHLHRVHDLRNFLVD